MSESPIRVLLIEDNPGDAHLVARYLAGEREIEFQLDTADRVTAGLDRLEHNPVDVVLLDLNLPDSSGLETFNRVHAGSPRVPVIVMTGQDDRALAVGAVRDGAQDYLVKGKVDTELLVRAIRYAIERQRAEEALRESRERYELAVAGAKDGIWDWDLRHDRVYFSSRWKEMLGYEPDEIGDQPDEWFNKVHPADLDALKKDISAHLNGGSDHFENEHRILHRDGSFRWVLARGIAVRDRESSTASRLAGSLTDVDARKTTEQQLLHDAMHDALTKLPNSALLLDRLGVALAQARRRKDYRFAVLFFDLDNFKAVNDTLGHALGDRLLIQVSRRIQTLLRPGDTVARLGGDEFAILAHGIEDPSDATRIAERIHEELRRPFDLEGHEVSTSASIGITLSSQGYKRPKDMLRDADTAMYRAKSLGKAHHAIFDEEMHHHAVELLKLETDLRRAIESNEFRLHYQPIVSLGDGRLEGFEALVRWQHPRRGLLYPKDFMPVAEETGLIVPIDWCVLREACGQMATWHRQLPFTELLSISVNLSRKQFAQPDLPDRIESILSQTGFHASMLHLEVSERLLEDDAEAILDRLGQLCELGIQIYLDDFATGFSVLSYLPRLPAGTVKLDRRFIRRLSQQGEGYRLVQSIVRVARSLGLKVAAEGLETAEQLARLQELHCEYGQGYLFSKPLDSESARELIARRPTW